MFTLSNPSPQSVLLLIPLDASRLQNNWIDVSMGSEEFPARLTLIHSFSIHIGECTGAHLWRSEENQMSVTVSGRWACWLQLETHHSELFQFLVPFDEEGTLSVPCPVTIAFASPTCTSRTSKSLSTTWLLISTNNLKLQDRKKPKITPSFHSTKFSSSLKTSDRNGLYKWSL